MWIGFRLEVPRSVYSYSHPTSRYIAVSVEFVFRNLKSSDCFSRAIRCGPQVEARRSPNDHDHDLIDGVERRSRRGSERKAESTTLESLYSVHPALEVLSATASAAQTVTLTEVADTARGSGEECGEAR
ncbi:hypothetical protein RRG08_051177 [Elysia crispata]|uniref:Uncharacterized protein n=1 Tax=Elysia crispata TaxID=231223 RepID=A0AAE0Z6K6_9GAST|nr:hypothetical protein RRG08_051177 [Elysia crispata]